MSPILMVTLCSCSLRGAHGSLHNIIINFPGPGDKTFEKTKSFKSLEVYQNFRYGFSGSSIFTEYKQSSLTKDKTGWNVYTLDIYLSLSLFI